MRQAGLGLGRPGEVSSGKAGVAGFGAERCVPVRQAWRVSEGVFGCVMARQARLGPSRSVEEGGVSQGRHGTVRSRTVRHGGPR